MAGIYIHIPFCKKACHYCNFHFSTSLHRKTAFVKALLKEIDNPQFPVSINPDMAIDTIYLGGGTPSLLDQHELLSIFQKIREKHNVKKDAEITLEANPDDISPEKLSLWKELGINRLSIGIQSFVQEDLVWMNRAHTAVQAYKCIEWAHEYGFDNLTIDLIYGTPTLSDINWKKNLRTAISLGINHLSCYALTVEKETALSHFIDKGKVPAISEDRQLNHFEMLAQWASEVNWEHYEISNLAKPGHESRHNSAYWKGMPYLGYGPSAHSFDGHFTRWMNVSNNSLYINSLSENGLLHREVEILTKTQRLNEMIMTGIRMKQGIEINETDKVLGGIKLTEMEWETFWTAAKKETGIGNCILSTTHLCLTPTGMFQADGIASRLFL